MDSYPRRCSKSRSHTSCPHLQETLHPPTSIRFELFQKCRFLSSFCSSRNNSLTLCVKTQDNENIYGNLTACQLLANMCVLLMYTGVNGPSTQQNCQESGSGVQIPCNDACSLHRRFYTDEDDNRLQPQDTGKHNTLEW